MNSETSIHDNETVYINPFLIFFTIFILPYLIFFMLMMFITGYMDPTLILDSVIEKRGAEFIKIWIIGSFVMSVIATVLISGIKIGNLMQKEGRRESAFAGGSVVIEKEHLTDSMPTISSETIESHKESSDKVETASLFADDKEHEDVYENETSTVFVVTPGTDTEQTSESEQTEDQKKRYNMLDKYVSGEKDL